MPRICNIPCRTLISLSSSLILRSRPGEVAVEIFASVEKAGKGFDGWLVEVANDFNRSNLRLPNGQSAKVKIRAIASGEGYQFIAAQKYLPDAYSPSHVLWMNNARCQGHCAYTHQ